jgi:hypothetical protein
MLTYSAVFYELFYIGKLSLQKKKLFLIYKYV